MFFIRTHARSDMGIGHLVRMTHLAQALLEQGCEVRFVVDVRNPDIVPFVKHFPVEYLYTESTLVDFDERNDATRFVTLLDPFPVDMVILDSYLLGVEWENVVVGTGYTLTVIDDLGNRRHNCDYLVDQRWCGPVETPKRYAGLVPDRCQRMLGPDYCMLGSQYRQKKSGSGPSEFTVMFSLGGGGDLSILAGLIRELLKDSELNIRLMPVLGPLSKNKDHIFSIAENDPRVYPVDSPGSLYDCYLEASLYVGALGTSLYELAAMALPALTFSYAQNQENEIVNLEDLGHYFHIDQEEFTDLSAVAKLILVFKENMERLRKIRERPAIAIDGLGVKRIAEVMTRHPSSDNAHMLHHGSAGTCLKNDYQEIADHILVRKVVDTDVNHYLSSRNLEKNSQNMVVGKIKRVNHYGWWFSNNRESYVVEKHGVKKLYIWHQLVRYEQNDYLIGGWFVCCHDTSLFDIATAALKWQLDLTASLFQNIPWIAVIKKTNKFVNLLNKYMGFQSVSESDEAFKAIMHIFNADPQEFNYVKFAREGYHIQERLY